MLENHVLLPLATLLLSYAPWLHSERIILAVFYAVCFFSSLWVFVQQVVQRKNYLQHKRTSFTKDD